MIVLSLAKKYIREFAKENSIRWLLCASPQSGLEGGGGLTETETRAERDEGKNKQWEVGRQQQK